MKNWKIGIAALAAALFATTAYAGPTLHKVKERGRFMDYLTGR